MNADTVARRLQATYPVLVVPQVDALCALLLEEEGVAGLVSLRPLPLELAPADTDLLSMQAPRVFKDLHVHADVSPLLSVAAALQRLQLVYGRAACVVSCGKAAIQVCACFYVWFFLPR